MRTHQSGKRILAMILALAMCLSWIPGAVLAEEQRGHVVINQVYGVGGNSGAVYTHDFV